MGIRKANMINIDSVKEADEAVAKIQIMNFISKTTLEQRNDMRKEQWFRERYKAWHSSDIRKQKNIGSLMILIEECNPDTIDEWVEYYFSTFTNFSKFKELVEKASKVLELSIEATVIYLWIHIIDFAWEGYSAEKKARERLNKQFPHLFFEKASEHEDKHYGIDLIVYDFMTGEKVGAIQIKGVGYFLGRNAISRMNGHKRGYTEFFKKTGIRIRYLLKETVYSQDELSMFPVECYGDIDTVDYKSIIPKLVSSVSPHKVLEV